MIKVQIHDLKSFENFLMIAGKFVQQGQLLLTKECSSLYCKNAKDFSTARLLLDTNAITLDKDELLNNIKVCIRDIAAFRSSINIIQVVEQVNTAELYIEELNQVDGCYAKYVQYKGKTKFKLICVDIQVIEQYVSQELNVTDMEHTWEFNIDPVRLDIIQNRTGSIVNVKDDVSIYLYGENTNTSNEDGTLIKHVMVDLNSRNSTYINSIALPIADTYNGELPEHLPEVAIHESSFRLLNILRVNDMNDLSCFFNKQYNIFFINSQLNDDSIWIKSRLLISIIKGK